MNKTTSALKLAEEALDSVIVVKDLSVRNKALAAIREALAEPVKQEPVAIVVEVDRHGDATVVSGAWQLDGGSHTFYAAPVDAEAIRAEALEEAAKCCDGVVRDRVFNAPDEYQHGRDMGATVCAAAIRGLK